MSSNSCKRERGRGREREREREGREGGRESTLSHWSAMEYVMSETLKLSSGEYLADNECQNVTMSLSLPTHLSPGRHVE